MTHDAATDLQLIAGLIEDMRFAMVTSVRADGSLHARPMAKTGADFRGELWFFTSRSSGKVDEVEGNDHVGVAFCDPGKNTWVSIAGRARLEIDRAKIRELWGKPVEAYFPGGPDDPDVALLHVTCDTAWYWDAHASKLVRAIEFAKALVTHHPPDMGDSGKVEL
jgi:general stress protein 26